MQSDPQQNHADETRHWTHFPKTSEQYSWWCAGFCLPATWFPLKSLSYYYSPGRMLCVSASIGWCRHKTTSFFSFSPLMAAAGGVAGVVPISLGCPLPLLILHPREVLPVSLSCPVKVKVKVKVYAGSYQRALRKSSELVLTLARAQPETRKKKNNRD